MTVYDATCPECGQKNTGMYLEETDGWMECAHCKKLHQFIRFSQFKTDLAFRIKEIKEEFPQAPVPVLGMAAGQ